MRTGILPAGPLRSWRQHLPRQIKTATLREAVRVPAKERGWRLGRIKIDQSTGRMKAGRSLGAKIDHVTRKYRRSGGTHLHWRSLALANPQRRPTTKHQNPLLAAAACTGILAAVASQALPLNAVRSNGATTDVVKAD